MHAGALLAERAAQAAGVHVARADLLGQKRHHDGRQNFQQLTGLARVEARGLPQPRFGARLRTAEDVAQDAARVQLPAGRRAVAEHAAQQAAEPAQAAGVAAAEQTAEHAAQVHTARAGAVVALQRAEQVGGAARLLGVAAERAHDHGQRGGNGVLRGVGVGAQLLRNLAGGRALQLAKQIVDERAVHGGVLA